MSFTFPIPDKYERAYWCSGLNDITSHQHQLSDDIIKRIANCCEWFNMGYINWKKITFEFLLENMENQTRRLDSSCCYERGRYYTKEIIDSLQQYKNKWRVMNIFVTWE